MNDTRPIGVQLQTTLYRTHVAAAAATCVWTRGAVMIEPIYHGDYLLGHAVTVPVPGVRAGARCRVEFPVGSRAALTLHWTGVPAGVTPAAEWRGPAVVAALAALDSFLRKELDPDLPTR